MSRKWTPLFGSFDVDDEVITFHGKAVSLASEAGEDAPTQAPAIGIILSNERMVNGVLSASFVFDRLDPISGGELILAHDIVSGGRHLAAGIPNFAQGCFGIREWRPRNESAGSNWGWTTLAIGGDRENLRPGRKYFLEARIQGSYLTLYLDEVEVAFTDRAPVRARPLPVGLWCCSVGEIKISDIRISLEKPKAFVVTQFSSPYDNIYTLIIKKLCNERQIEALRADEIYGPGLIIRDIIQRITSSQILIADITPCNPNVYFEIGYALALNKPIILLAEKGTKLPFDVSPFRVLFYENTLTAREVFETELLKHLDEILKPAG
jgi:hypothetical protein